MPRTIQDEYTNRTDIPKWKKFYLRHPGRQAELAKKWRAAHPGRQTEANRRWRQKNPEKYAAAIKRYGQAVCLKRLRKKQADWGHAVEQGHNTISRSRRQEILWLYKRGRSLAQIVVWMGIPASVVLRIIQQATLNENPSYGQTDSSSAPANP